MNDMKDIGTYNVRTKSQIIESFSQLIFVSRDQRRYILAEVLYSLTDYSRANGNDNRRLCSISGAA